MLWRLIAVDKNTNQPGPVPHGLVDCAIFNCQGSAPSYNQEEKFKADKKLAAQFCRHYNIPSQLPPNLKYKLERLFETTDDTAVLLCISRAIPIIDGQGVQGGMTAPAGQRGQNRMPGPVTQGGFQELGDQDLPAGGDSDGFYSDPSEGAYMDLVQTGGGFAEQARPRVLPQTGYSEVPG